jgi:hypothetical protein
MTNAIDAALQSEGAAGHAMSIYLASLPFCRFAIVILALMLAPYPIRRRLIGAIGIRLIEKLSTFIIIVQPGVVSARDPALDENILDIIAHVLINVTIAAEIYGSTIGTPDCGTQR